MLLALGVSLLGNITAKKMKFYIKDFFSKCDQVLSMLAGKEVIRAAKGTFSAGLDF